MKFSIVMTTCDRPQFLYHALKSIRRQDIQDLDHEIIVVEDGRDNVSSKRILSRGDIADKLNLRYVYSGYRTYPRWRNMGFAANIGIRQATGEIVALTNSDIYHLGDTIRPVITACEKQPKVLSTLNKVYDDNGLLIESLSQRITTRKQLDEVIRTVKQSNPLKGVYPANPDMPFFLAIRRKYLLEIGGYDEDFIGSASEDCDLLDRLQAIGCRYVYAPEGSEAVHLYHGRRTIVELKENPGFAHNVRLRKERQGVIERNRGRDWGVLHDPTRTQDGAPMHLVLWVTSKCNLDCPCCNQKAARQDYANYSMKQDELSHIIESCKQRDIHFSTIEFTGGEPTLWPLFDSAIAQLKDSGITDNVTFITNGNDAARVAGIANRHNLFYVVSRNQCTAQQEAIHQRTGTGLLWNNSCHHAVPKLPIAGSLPAICSQRQDAHGQVVRQLFYLKGKVWYCCMAYTNKNIVGMPPILSCPFDEDFPQYFYHRDPNLAICSVCLCNQPIWNHLEGLRCALL